MHDNIKNLASRNKGSETVPQCCHTAKWAIFYCYRLVTIIEYCGYYALVPASAGLLTNLVFQMLVFRLSLRIMIPNGQDRNQMEIISVTCGF